MAKEPWELTQAFAEQLMRQAAQTEQQATRVQLAPIEQAMALDRLKQQGELELANLPRRLSTEDQFKQLQEARGLEQKKELAADEDERTQAAERRKIEQLPETLAAQTKARLALAKGNVEQTLQIYKEHGKLLEEAQRAVKGGIGVGRSAVTDYHRPPTREGLEIPKLLPKDIPTRKMFLKDLADQGYEVVDTESAWGGDYVHTRKKPKSDTPPPKKEEVKSGPSLGRRLLNKITGSDETPKAGAPPVAGAAPKADKAPPPPEPVSTRPAASIPFSSVGPADPLPASARSIPSMVGDTRLPLPEMKGDPIAGKDKMSFLYESIRRRGYNDDEAKTILANVINKPETKPTDDPDVFDVLVA